MASSSSPRPWRFDVFLSFRGEDTRRTIVSHLHNGLQSRGIIVFKDDRKLRTGDSISDELPKAIEDSRFAVVVISKDYASSRWCLYELEMIMECKKKGTLTVIPIFYEVDPSNVRTQTGTFAQAFEKHTVRESAEKVQKWRKALSDIASLAGMDSRKCLDEAALVSEIVGDISNRLFSMLSGDFGDIIGMDAHMEALDPLLSLGSSDEVRMIGIWGMGGVGKTTIAIYLYSKLCYQFPLHCFMENIKKISSEHGLVYLQGQFLSEILHEKDLKLRSLEFGSSAIKARLGHQKVLAILDDVDKLDQLCAMARETSWFGPGSIIIITTRDKGLLISHNIKLVHEIKCLGNEAALRLFNHFAFRGRPISYDFMCLSVCASRLVHGLPLALKVFGSFLCGRTIEEWEASIHKLRGDPRRDVVESLKVSYDGLHERDKVIFLCVACLFNEERVSRVSQLFDDEELEVSNSLKMLEQKSLIDISKDGLVIVHDLIQEMAKDIVYQQSTKDPGKRRFLWDSKEIYNVLEYGMGTDVVEGILLNMSEMPNFFVGNWAFQNMQNLRFIKIYSAINCAEDLPQSRAALISLPCRLRLLDWSDCPLTALPSTFRAEYLIELRLPFSNLEKLWEGTLNLGNLKRMDLSFSLELKEIPDLSRATNLEELDVSYCYNLVEVPLSFSSLIKLGRLSMRGCRKLEFLPSTLGLPSLKIVNLEVCLSLESFPKLSESIVELYLYETGIKEVPDEGIQSLTALEVLNLSGCKMLLQIPSTIGNLTSLKKLNLRSCENLKIIPNTIGNLTALQELDLGSCKKLTNIPSTIGNLSGLETLTLSGCKMLSAIPSTIGNLTALKRLYIPEDINGIGNILSSNWNAECFRYLNDYQGTVEFPHLEGNIEVYWERALEDCALEGFGLKREGNNPDGIPVRCTSLSSFPNLRKLCLRNLNILEIPSDINCLQALHHLDLSGNDFKTLPASMKQLSLLEELILSNCKKLLSVPMLPPDLKHLYVNDCSSLKSIFNIIGHSFQKLMLCSCFELIYVEELLFPDVITPAHKGDVKTWAYLSPRKLRSFGSYIRTKKELASISFGHELVGFVAEIVVCLRTPHRISDFSVCCRWHGEANQTGGTSSFPDNLPSHVSDSYAESAVLLAFSCNFGEERYCDKISFKFELDCKMSYDCRCCQIVGCEISLRFPEKVHRVFSDRTRFNRTWGYETCPTDCISVDFGESLPSITRLRVMRCVPTIGYP